MLLAVRSTVILTAILGRPTSPPDAARRGSFALLVPAHDGEHAIGRLLVSTWALDRPAACFDVRVVSDNCGDRAAKPARDGGAQVEERTNHDTRGKVYALRWLPARLRERGARYDAYVMIDADTVVVPDLPRQMDIALTPVVRSCRRTARRSKPTNRRWRWSWAARAGSGSRRPMASNCTGRWWKPV
jgi:cellulose synthase/poly-beta-1,6-N-acetylglucosamine synthase-like glycosyltransferase